jgi:hypothetical protein
MRNLSSYPRTLPNYYFRNHLNKMLQFLYLELFQSPNKVLLIINMNYEIFYNFNCLLLTRLVIDFKICIFNE